MFVSNTYDTVDTESIKSSFSRVLFLCIAASTSELVNTFISQSTQPGPLVSLKCSAIGNPIPRITWSIDGLLITSQKQIFQHSQNYYSRISVASYHQKNGEVVSHLNISNAQVEDSGLFQCKASNLVGNLSHSSRLNIYGQPVIPNLRFDEEQRRRAKNSSFLQRDIRRPSYRHWFKDSLPISDWLNITETRPKFLSVLMFEELYHAYN
ncbi:unnamed protein product [Orchesella dallaii]|uniref:Ig-like domain-containing protein n=1 Tax=Orchesella dallaii TaxID=48710 RepID=A0ABP1RJB3_9HEXA